MVRIRGNTALARKGAHFRRVGCRKTTGRPLVVHRALSLSGVMAHFSNSQWERRARFIFPPGTTRERSMEASSLKEAGSALSGHPTYWHAIDWRHMHWVVRGMQVRIAKATREGDWRKVKALQRMLTRSMCARMGGTPGDGERPGS